MTKRCPRCKEVKAKELFDKRKLSKDGCSAHCKVCRKASRDSPETKAASTVRRKQYYEDNKEAVLQQQKKSREKDPEKYKKADAEKYLRSREKIIARVGEYQKDNPEINRAAGKKYRKSTPHLQAAKASKRRAVKLKATPKWIEDEFEQLFLIEIYHLAQLRSAATGFEWHVDHAVPLTSKKVCGLHCMANLQLLPAIENIKKHNRFWPDMWLDSDFIIVDNNTLIKCGEQL